MRKVAGGLVRDLSEAEIVEDRARALAEGGLGGTRAPAAEEEAGKGRIALEVVGDDHVLEGGHLAEDGGLLEGPDHSPPGDRVRRLAGDLLPAEADPPRGRPQERGDELEQGALAGPVRADDAEDPALPDRERHVVDRGETPEALGEALDLEEAHGRFSGIWSHRLQPAPVPAPAPAPGPGPGPPPAALPPGRPRLSSPFGSQSISPIMSRA